MVDVNPLQLGEPPHEPEIAVGRLLMDSTLGDPGYRDRSSLEFNMRLDRFDEETDRLVAEAVHDGKREIRLNELNRRRRKIILLSLLYVVVVLVVSVILLRLRGIAVSSIDDTQITFGHILTAFACSCPLLGAIENYSNVVSEMRLLKVAGALKKELAHDLPSCDTGK